MRAERRWRGCGSLLGERLQRIAMAVAVERAEQREVSHWRRCSSRGETKSREDPRIDGFQLCTEPCDDVFERLL